MDVQVDIMCPRCEAYINLCTRAWENIKVADKIDGKLNIT